MTIYSTAILLVLINFQKGVVQILRPTPITISKYFNEDFLVMKKEYPQPFKEG
jgi:hypothetical protein